MALEDAWRCVDDVAGTSVDTFCYMVERGDGLFYPSKVGAQFGSDMVDSGFWLVAFYRAWHNMKSLEERGLDPLRVIIDRCHEQGVGAATACVLSPPAVSDRPYVSVCQQMEFIASVRITSYLGLEDLGVKFERSATDGALNQPTEGGALALPEAREHQRLVLEELITDCERATHCTRPPTCLLLLTVDSPPPHHHPLLLNRPLRRDRAGPEHGRRSPQRPRG